MNVPIDSPEELAVLDADDDTEQEALQIHEQLLVQYRDAFSRLAQ
jgi:hypothetical protein